MKKVLFPIFLFPGFVLFNALQTPAQQSVDCEFLWELVAEQRQSDSSAANLSRLPDSTDTLVQQNCQAWVDSLLKWEIQREERTDTELKIVADDLDVLDSQLTQLVQDFQGDTAKDPESAAVEVDVYKSNSVSAVLDMYQSEVDLFGSDDFISEPDQQEVSTTTNFGAELKNYYSKPQGLIRLLDHRLAVLDEYVYDNTRFGFGWNPLGRDFELGLNGRSGLRLNYKDSTSNFIEGGLGPELSYSPAGALSAKIYFEGEGRYNPNQSTGYESYAKSTTGGEAGWLASNWDLTLRADGESKRYRDSLYKDYDQILLSSTGHLYILENSHLEVFLERENLEFIHDSLGVEKETRYLVELVPNTSPNQNIDLSVFLGWENNRYLQYDEISEDLRAQSGLDPVFTTNYRFTRLYIEPNILWQSTNDITFDFIVRHERLRLKLDTTQWQNDSIMGASFFPKEDPYNMWEATLQMTVNRNSHSLTLGLDYDNIIYIDTDANFGERQGALTATSNLYWDLNDRLRFLGTLEWPVGPSKGTALENRYLSLELEYQL